MLRDITIGQYYEKESVIHKLDPRLKFIATHGLYDIRILFFQICWIDGLFFIFGIYR